MLRIRGIIAAEDAQAILNGLDLKKKKGGGERRGGGDQGGGGNEKRKRKGGKEEKGWKDKNKE
jgi:hypothetical protein